MNTTMRTVSLLAASGLLALVPMMATAATTVVTRWAPGHVTTVRTYGPYWGVAPARCCSYGGVVAGVAAGLVTGAAIASASAPKPAVVYAPPTVVTYAPPVVYVAPPPVRYYYVP